MKWSNGAMLGLACVISTDLMHPNILMLKQRLERGIWGVGKVLIRRRHGNLGAR